MNIFKVLANGDGSINEANVSAFLGYLLDPKADHALGHEFLKAFLEHVISDEDFDPEKYEYQVFYEQAFKEGNLAKQIVDIVLVCYTINLGNGKESLFKEFLNNRKEVKRIFLIENKIKSGSITQGQLERQFNSTVSELKDNVETEIHSVYITPENPKFYEDFETAKINLKSHLFWNRSEDEPSIKSILLNIIKMEAKGEIEPLNQYTLHTIKAFVQFIENDFKSEKQVEKARLNDGSYIEKFEKLNLKSNIVEKLETLKSKLESVNPKLIGKIYGPDLSSKRHPKLFLIIDGIKLGLNAGYSSRDKLSLGFHIDKNTPESKDKLINLANKLNIDLKKPDDKFGSYCRTAAMQKTILFSNINKINESIQHAIQLIES